MWWWWACCVTATYAAITAGTWAIRSTCKGATVDQRADYIAANVVKSIALLVICIVGSANVPVWDIIVENRWDNYTVMLFIPAYGALDMVTLFTVDRLPTTTMYHHIAVAVVTVAMTCVDLTNDNSGLVRALRTVIIYGMFSCGPYLVNLFLAARIHATYIHLARLTTVIYVVSIGLNCTCMATCMWANLVDGYYVSVFLTSIPIGIFIRDDLILLASLLRFSDWVNPSLIF